MLYILIRLNIEIGTLSLFIFNLKYFNGAYFVPNFPEIFAFILKNGSRISLFKLQKGTTIHFILRFVSEFYVTLMQSVLNHSATLLRGH